MLHETTSNLESALLDFSEKKIVIPAATEKFVALRKLRYPYGGVTVSGDTGFQKRFLGEDAKVENPISEHTLTYAQLKEDSVTPLIIAELGGEEKAETTLAEMHFLMMKEDEYDGKFGTLLTRGAGSNIFYIRDKNGVLWEVTCSLTGACWYLSSLSIENRNEFYRHHTGSRVFFRHPADRGRIIAEMVEKDKEQARISELINLNLTKERTKEREEETERERFITELVSDLMGQLGIDVKDKMFQTDALLFFFGDEIYNRLKKMSPETLGKIAACGKGEKMREVHYGKCPDYEHEEGLSNFRKDLLKRNFASQQGKFLNEHENGINLLRIIACTVIVVEMKRIFISMGHETVKKQDLRTYRRFF